MKRTIGVIGLGNPLQRDDGIGLLLLHYLYEHKKSLTKNIDFIDGGTSGMNLFHLLEKFETLFVIDAVDFKGKPGETKTFSLDEVKNQKLQFFLSTHEPDFLTLIAFLKKLGNLPKQVVFFGVQPKDVTYGDGLSVEVSRVLPSIKKQVLKEIKALKIS
jgi:hydrogenase maturation protease